jgi:hypothetical protein
LYSEIGGFYYAQEIVFDASLSYNTQLGLLSELFRRCNFSSSLWVCSVRERSGMECHGSIPEEWNGSVPAFGWD